MAMINKIWVEMLDKDLEIERFLISQKPSNNIWGMYLLLDTFAVLICCRCRKSLYLRFQLSSYFEGPLSSNREKIYGIFLCFLSMVHLKDNIWQSPQCSGIFQVLLHGGRYWRKIVGNRKFTKMLSSDQMKCWLLFIFFCFVLFLARLNLMLLRHLLAASQNFCFFQQKVKKVCSTKIS